MWGGVRGALVDIAGGLPASPTTCRYVENRNACRVKLLHRLHKSMPFLNEIQRRGVPVAFRDKPTSRDRFNSLPPPRLLLHARRKSHSSSAVRSFVSPCAQCTRWVLIFVLCCFTISLRYAAKVLKLFIVYILYSAFRLRERQNPAQFAIPDHIKRVCRRAFSFQTTGALQRGMRICVGSGSFKYKAVSRIGCQDGVPSRSATSIFSPRGTVSHAAKVGLNCVLWFKLRQPPADCSIACTSARRR